MADINELFSALQKADAAGNKEDARQIANMIRQVGGAYMPKAPEEKPDTGFTGAAKASYQTLKGDIAALAGKTGLMDVAEAEKYQKERQEEAKRVFKPTEEGWTEAPLLKARELLGGSVPYMAAPIAAGVAAGALPLTGVAATAAGLGAAGLASGAQFTGSNLSRQMEAEGKSLKDTDLLAAGAAAIPQAALDVVGLKYIPGIQRIFKSVGKEVSEEAARKMLEQGTLRTAGQYIAGGAKIAGIEGGTEAGQAFFERLQAGLNIADKDARKEYLDNFIGGAVLGGVASPFGVRGTRNEAGEVVAKADAAQAAIAQQEEQAQEQQAELQKQQLKTGQLFGEAMPGEKEVSRVPNRPELYDTGEVYTTGAPEDIGKPILAARQNAPETTTVREREATELSQLEAQKAVTVDPVEKQKLETEIARLKERPTDQQFLAKSYDTFQTQLNDIEKQRDAAAEKGDFKQFAALDSQARTLEEANKDLLEKVKADKGLHYIKEEKRYVPITPEVEMAKLRGEQKNLIKQLQGMTGPSYDAKRAATLTEKLGTIESRLQEVSPSAAQLDLFEPAQLAAEERTYKKQQAEARTQEQADLLEALKPENRKEVLNKEAIDRYQQGLKDLEDAYAEGADERTIDSLINNLQTSMLERGVKSAAGVEEAGVKPERIKAAIAEAQQDYANATTDEEKAAAIANMGALQKRFATLRAESVVTPELRQQQAQNAQRLAHDSVSDLLDDIKAGQKPSPNAQSIIANAYTKAAIDDVNALREKVNQTTLSNDEALKLAYEVQDIVGAVVRKVDTSAVGRLDASTPTSLERRIDTIKSKYSQGKPLKVQKGEDLLRAGRDPAAMLREATGGKERDAVEAAEKKVAEAKAGVEEVKGREAEALKEKKRLAPYYMEAAKEKLKEAKKELAEAQKALNDFEPDQKRIAQIKSEVEKLKKEDERIAAEKAKQEAVDTERYAPSGVDPDQFNLFGEKAYETETTKYEPTAVVRATPENFQRFVGIQANKFKQAKEAAERAIAEAKERATKAKERADAKATENAQELSKQIAEQRAFVQDVTRADQIVSDLRGQATRLWQERGRLVKELKAATKENKKIIRNAIAEIDNTTEERNAEIDALHKRANELHNANLEREQALLDRLEKAYAKTPEAKTKAAIVAARAAIGQTEAAIDANLKKQIKETRVAEQKAMEFKASLPVMRQEVVTTNRKAVGTGEALTRKKATAVVFPGVTDRKTGEVLSEEVRYPVTPKTAEEKTAAARERAREAALEMKALKEPVSYKMAPKEMAKTIEELRTLAIGNTQKGNKTLANAQLKRAAELQKILEKAEKENVAAQRALAVLGNKPGRVSSKAKPSAAEKATAAANEKTAKQIEDARRTERQYANEANISLNEYGDIIAGLKHSFRARIEPSDKRVQMSQESVKKVIAGIKLPKGLNIKVLAILPEGMKQYIRERGYDPDTIKGFVTANGQVVVVANNHADAKQVEKTVAHEVTGHMGVEAILGEAGMKALTNKVIAQNGGVMQLATKLGVEEDAYGAYAAAKNAGETEEKAQAAAVSEMIAHVAEAEPTKSFLAKANDFIKALVGAMRAGLRRMGLDLDISTSDIYKIIRDARKDFKVAPGAHKTSTGNVQFSGKPSYNSKYADLGSDIDSIVSGQKTMADRIKASATGMKSPKDLMKPQGILSEANRLAFRTRYIDRFAPIEKIAGKLAEKFKDSLKGTQLMYYMRMHDQLLNWTAQIASSGPVDLVEKKRADGKTERIIESNDKASLKKVAEALKKADVGDAQAANTLFTFYLAAKRAQRVGLSTLNFGPNVTQAKLDKVLDRVNADKQTKTAFDEASKIYNEYNKGLVNFAVKTGALSKDLAKVLTDTEDYIPFYRVDKDGNVIVEVGGAKRVTIGNLKDQPYLHELVGGDTAILDVFTSSLQNTKMLTDMALRNLATRNVAFSLQELGLLNIKKNRAGDKIGSGIYDGPGPADDRTIRFKMDGKDYHAVVDTDTVGIPAELLVQGMEGVKTSIPNLVRIAGIPARLLRSYITRNPAYAVRQIARDSLSNAFTTGANSVPVLDNLKQLGSMWGGKNATESLLKQRGILGGQVIGGASDAMQKAMLQIVEGKPGWEKAMAYLDHLAIMGDASSRVTSYNSFIKQGLSDMEATLATLEAMNFNKRGTSPSMYLLNQMVPFLNAQVQGMDVLYKAFTGKMPFAEKLAIKQKILARGALMAGMTMAYAAMKYDDDDYKNATTQQRIGNWFIKVPGIDESIKVPIPFEIGGIFKMLPEMVYATAFRDKKLEDAAKEIADYSRDQFIPSVTPTALKPFIELPTNHSFFTGKPIESARLKNLEPGQRAYNSTPEALKTLGEVTGVSPVMMEYLLRNFTGSLPLAMISLANPVLSKTGEAAEGRGFPSSTTPVVGAFFQPKDANGLIDKAYEEMENAIQAKSSYNNLVESGRDKEADELLTKKADLLGMASAAGSFRQKMGALAKQEREVHAMTGVSGKEKREMLDLIKQEKILLAQDLISARE